VKYTILFGLEFERGYLISVTFKPSTDMTGGSGRGGHWASPEASGYTNDWILRNALEIEDLGDERILI
jgi:hypothetical protein